ncbi:protein Skeletor, isoforms B/C [Macrosteles quadrilineatus]|uniref:protein Skeletor, isoforms B/C n=1 Tax=Macrosteles quadrilineatus TaxID=74068 RepID=UPI0023E195A4|nr:protein Skeletor, isoforms B/C [Macrosteles quadrilineatus]
MIVSKMLFHLVFHVLLYGLVCGEQYRGKHLGKLNSYHHQVSGDVYAVDEFTLLLTEFSYDGNGPDSFFWAGASNRPGPQGFIVPDEHGKTNVLSRYFNKDFTLTLPDRKKITDIKWFAIYDLLTQSAFGDVYIPEEFEPPAVQTISSFGKKSHGVSSGPLRILDAKTLVIPEFTYNGAGKDTYFWVGVGPQPSSKGTKVPDENGYMESLRLYAGETITLELPGELTIFDIDWLSVYNVETKENYGSVIVPDNPNVPPSLIKIIPHKSTLPNCIQLHKDYQVSWEIFGPQITIQLAGQVGEDHYLAFGLSGAPDKIQMLGSDVAIAYIDGYRGFANDYNITANSPCVKVLGQYKGVCKDDLIGGIDNNQMHTASREDGINYITYRRTLISSESGDREFKEEGPSQLIWAMGRLDHKSEPAFHDFYPRGSLSVELGRKEPYNTCFSFTRTYKELREPWERPKIIDRTLRTFTATLGPAGGKRGYQGITGMPSNGLAWYINGLLVPEIWMRRGFTYAIRIYGGNNPHSAEFYNPLIITDEPHGGLERLSEVAQRKIRVLAGVQFTLRGQPRPTSAGPLCLARHKGVDRRLDDDFPTFRKFNRSLSFTCEEGDPAILEVTPNSSWPDVVYYNSYTHHNMGWKLHVVDSLSLAFTSDANTTTIATAVQLALFFLLFVFR